MDNRLTWTCKACNSRSIQTTVSALVSHHHCTRAKFKSGQVKRCGICTHFCSSDKAHVCEANLLRNVLIECSAVHMPFEFADITLQAPREPEKEAYIIVFVAPIVKCIAPVQTTVALAMPWDPIPGQKQVRSFAFLIACLIALLTTHACRSSRWARCPSTSTSPRTVASSWTRRGMLTTTRWMQTPSASVPARGASSTSARSATTLLQRGSTTHASRTARAFCRSTRSPTTSSCSSARRARLARAGKCLCLC